MQGGVAAFSAAPTDGLRHEGLDRAPGPVAPRERGCPLQLPPQGCVDQDAGITSGLRSNHWHRQRSEPGGTIGNPAG
jgi:hypothetical protein